MSEGRQKSSRLFFKEPEHHLPLEEAIYKLHPWTTYMLGVRSHILTASQFKCNISFLMLMYY